MTSIDRIFAAVRMDYAASAFLHAILRSTIVFLALYLLFTLPTAFGINFTLLGITYDLFISGVIAIIVFSISFFIKLSQFSFVDLERRIPAVKDILHTAKEYRRKNNPFKDYLFEELRDAASSSSTGGFINPSLLMRQITVIVVLSIALVGFHAVSDTITAKLKDIIPQFISDYQRRSTSPGSPQIELLNDDSIYGAPSQIIEIQRNAKELRLQAGSTGGNFDETTSFYDQTFDRIYETQHIEAIVEHTQVQKLPKDVELARTYSLKLRELR